jgi:type VI secretion system secreted protein VgrG
VPDHTRRAYQFHSGAIDDGVLLVAAFTGHERISAPFRYELNLRSARADLDGAALLASDCWLAIQQPTLLAGSGRRGVQLLKLHGVLASFEQHGRDDESVHYRAVLVPHLWRLSLTRQSRIFQDLSVQDIVTQVLAKHGITEIEFNQCDKGTAVREHVVQYRETDLDFLHRQLEHVGIFYTIEHGEQGPKLVFGGCPESCRKLPGSGGLQFRTHVGSAERGEALVAESVQALAIRHQPVPEKVVVGDWNWRTPDDPLFSEHAVDAQAVFGSQYEHGDHFKDDDEGAEIATVRAEELAWRKLVYHGTSDARGLRAGMVFTLSDHYRGDANTDHLVVEIRHQGSQGFATADTDVLPAALYSNEFTSIPAAVPFRPRRTTPKPVIPGTITARVDAAGDGQYAELDDQGRYKLKFAFDRSDLQDGKASRFVRMAQPYAGDDMGMHFPLHKGTEVLVTHVNGDPDRPVIASAVPNPQTGSKVSSGNQSQSVIKTGGGNSVTMEDTAGAEGFNVNATYDYSLSAGHDSSVSVGNNATTSVSVDSTSSVGANDSQTVGSNRTVSIGANLEQTVGANQTDTIGADATLTIGANHSVAVGANQSISVGANLSQNVGGKASVVAGGPLSLSAPAISIGADGKISLSVGGSSIVIDAGGITIHAPKVTLVGDGKLEASAPVVKVAADGACEIGGATVDVKASGPITLKGAMVKNNA